MDVSIIIVHYNTPKLTEQCVQSVIDKTKRVSYEVIVVDNASTVHDAHELKDKFPSIKLVKSAINLGFAGGNNLGLKEAVGEYILLLNSDTVLINDAVSLTFDYLKKHPKVGVVSAQLQYPDGNIQSVCQRFPSIRYTLFELLRIQKLLPKKNQGHLLLGAFFDHKSRAKADWVWGAYFMFCRNILYQLPEEKLNDSYFMYAEDMQWCLDIHRLGYEIHYFPDAKVIHYMGGSSADKQLLMKDSIKRFLDNNYSPFHKRIILALEALFV